MTALHTSRHKFLFLFLLLAFAVVLIELRIIHLPQFTTHAFLPLAVTLDLVVGIPALYYLFVVRLYRVSASTTVAVFLVCLYLATFLLPANHHLYLFHFKRVALLAEPVLLVLGAVRIRRIVREYKRARTIHADFERNLADSFRAVFGNSLWPVVSELTMVGYAIGIWRRTSLAPTQHAFSTHRKSGFSALLITILFLSVVEMTAVHLLVMRWNHSVALALLLLGCYSLLFLFAHLRAVQQRPVLLEGSKLSLTAGLIWRCEIDLHNIQQLEPLKELTTIPKDIFNLAKPLLTPPNLLLTSHAPLMVRGMYGLSKSTHMLAFYVDQPQELLSQLQRSPLT